MLTEQELLEKAVDEMTDAEILERIVRLGFNGDQQCFSRFVERLRQELPEGTEVALRGSVITGQKHEGGYFDAGGPGTSDLDVALLGDKVMEMWDSEYFYVPRINTRPLSDECPQAAPPLNALRESLQEMVGRPVNFQAMSGLFLEGREKIARQPFLKIIKDGEPGETAPPQL